MKSKNINNIVMAILFLVMAISLGAAAQQDSAKPKLLLNVGYYMNNNQMVYLLANTKAKISGKFKQVPGIAVTVYLDKESPDLLIGKTITNEEGLGKLIIPASLKSVWDASAQHQFIGSTEATKEYESATAETDITKSKITVDTISDGETRKIDVSVSAYNGKDWIPAPDVELKVGVARLGGSLLTAGDEATYTTDSTGKISAELLKKNLPGDEKGNLILVARVDENDTYGNLKVEKTVPWGVAVKPNLHFFDQRTLWSTRFKTPIWLLAMAYSIVLGVWGTIIYLVFQIIKIKKLGTSKEL
jgi:hypothetical protein